MTVVKRDSGKERFFKVCEKKFWKVGKEQIIQILFRWQQETNKFVVS